MMTRNTAAHILMICLSGFIVYSNALHAPFVWDDIRLVINNPFVENFYLTADAVKNDEELYKHAKQRYITMFSFKLNYKIHGRNPYGFHAVNLAIHLLNATLVYLFIILTFKTPFLKDAPLRSHDRHIALLSGLVFVSHPIQIEAVTYIFQRLASLATLFYLLSVVMYVKARLLMQKYPPAQAADGGIGRRYAAFCYICSLVAVVAGMFTKENTFTIPLVIVMYEVFFFPGRFSRRIPALIPFVLALSIIPLHYLYGLERPFDASTREYSFIVHNRLDYLLTQFRVIMTYIRLIFLPVGQNLDYDYPLYNSFLNGEVFPSFLFLTALFCSGIFFYLRSRTAERGLRIAAFGIFWFFITLSVESGLIPLRLWICEYRMYLPSVGFFSASASVIFLVLIRITDARMKVGAFLAVGLLLSGYAYAAYQRNALWADEESLWKDTAEKSPEKFLPYYNLYMFYMQQGRHGEALRMLTSFLRRNPADILAHRALGTFYDDVGRFDEAIVQFQQVLKLSPDDARAHYDIGVAFCRMGRLDDGVVEFRKALAINPGLIDAYNGIGVAYDEQGRYADAINEYHSALRLSPYDIKTHENLGIAYFHGSRFEEAEREFNHVLAGAPDSATTKRYLSEISRKRYVR